MGGVKNIYIALYGNYGFTVAGSEVTSLGTLEDVYKYEFNAKTESLSEDLVVDGDTGNAVNTQTLAGTIPGLDAELQKELSLLAKSRSFIFVEDKNGNIKLAGLEHGVTATSLKAQTGAAPTDMSGYTIEFVATEKDLAPLLSSSVKTALKAAVINDYIGA